MAFKLIAFTALMAVAQAGLVPTHGYAASPAIYAHAAPAVYAQAAPAVYAHAAPVHAKVLVAEAPAQYSFQYGVHDAHTGDVKEQHEERNGDVVKGYYTLNDADGTKRTVHYTADDHNGFNAVVQREGHPVHPVAVKAVAPVVKAVHAAPVYAHAAPAVYAHASPAVYSHASPAVYSHASPAVYSHAAPAVYSHAAPAVYAQAAPAVYAHASPAVYAHAAPQLAYAGHGYHH